MDETPFAFNWSVDQHGYELEATPDASGLAGQGVFIKGRGGPLRYYWPLEKDGLWLQFAETCQSRDGVLQFAGEFGLLRGRGSAPERVGDILLTAARLSQLGQRLQAGDRLAATKLFNGSGLPEMKEAILWYAAEPERFHFRLIPLSLRHALFHQAAEAITGNRRFRRCRNVGCPRWFRLGPRAATDSRHTYTARREFCSDRCRVADARRRKREAIRHA
jgi:hypothetical protein